jgi:hypothetical protein
MKATYRSKWRRKKLGATRARKTGKNELRIRMINEMIILFIM